jgi:hypothetical protein
MGNTFWGNARHIFFNSVQFRRNFLHISKAGVPDDI